MNAVTNIEPTAAARILNVTQDEYYADPCVTPSLSQSVAHTLVSQSPLHAWAQHPRLGNCSEREQTTALTDGTVIHKLILGKGGEIVIIRANDFRTKQAQELRDAAFEAGQTPILEHKYADLAATAALLRKRWRDDFGIEFTGVSEVALEWTEETSDGPVLCRGMLDHVMFDAGIIYDIKKTRSAHPKECGKSMINYGYDIQHAAYTSALGKLLPQFDGRVQMKYLFMELDAPHAVVPAELSGMLREHGESRWSRAFHIWQRCLKRNQWPSYTDKTVVLEAPAWAMTEEMGTEW